MGLPRSTFYHRVKERDDKPLRVALSDLAAKRRRWGYRRLLVLLRRRGFVDNHKRVFRIYQQEGLQVCKRKGRKTSKWRGEKPPAPERANERWSLDFVHDVTRNGRKVRLLNVIDDFTRECLSIEVDTSLTGERVTRVLDQIVEMRGWPDAILTDNGPEFTSQVMEKWSYSSGVKHQFIEPGKPVQNAYVESFNGKLRDECLNEYWFANLHEARMIVEEWRIDYNEARPHSGLGYRTPAEFAASCSVDARTHAELCGNNLPSCAPPHGGAMGGFASHKNRLPGLSQGTVQLMGAGQALCEGSRSSRHGSSLLGISRAFSRSRVFLRVLEIAQAFAIGQLCKGHRKKLVPT